MGNTKARHHAGQHQQLSQIAREIWTANPHTLCARCGLTRAEGIARWGRQGEWDAGHRVDGTIATSLADYQPEHSHCNRSAGATTGNRNRRRTSRDWG